MKQDDLDRILSREEEILPSSGFAASVMEAVRQEAAAPAPIPFPWKRALPLAGAAVLALACVVAAGVALLVRGPAPQAPSAAWPPAMTVALAAAKSLQLGWALLALVLSYACVKLSRRLAAG